MRVDTNLKVIHTYPTDDKKPHITSGWPPDRCWCRPQVDEYDGGTHIIHNSVDRRESYEERLH